MNIVHAPTEIAGQMNAFVEGLRKFGHSANGYNWFHTYINYRGSIVNTDAYELMKAIDPVVRYADLIHFHNGNTFEIRHSDLPLIYETGKPIVMHHWGNDVRTRRGAAARNPYPIPPSYMTDDAIHGRLSLLSRYIRHAIVQDYELYPYVSDYYPHVHMLPLACRVRDLPVSYPSKSSRNPMVVHAPTNRAFKGSAHVEKAIGELTGIYPFTYCAVERKSHAEAMNMYAAADIVVDQLLCGTYGMLSVEAMSMGKVVVAFVMDEVKARFPDHLPIVIANPDTIRDVLAGLLRDPELRHRIGMKSRAYAESYHDIACVIPKLQHIYRQAERSGRH